MFEFIAALFAMGIVFWLALLFLLAVAVLLSEFEKPDFALGLVVLAGVALWFFKGVNILALTWANLALVLTYVVAYAMIGIIWSMFKWDRYSAQCRKDYMREVNKVHEWNTNYPNQISRNIPKFEDYVPVALKNKRKFITWIVLWWASMFWYVFSDLIQDFVEFVLRRLGKIYDAIAWRHFKDLKK